MEEDIQLRTYTVADLKEWLIHNRPKDGLSSAVIAPERAYALMHNPYVQDNMNVVCAIFINDEVAAFTAAFPEYLNKPNNRLAWWFTTLWCNPAYMGRGYGLVVIGTLAEEYGIENCFDAEGAPETVSIMNMLGLTTVYKKKYVFSEKLIHKDSFRGKMAWLVNRGKGLLRSRHLRLCWKNLDRIDFSISYQRYVDDESYAFIRAHSDNYFILRQQNTLNWILQYPFLQTAPLTEKGIAENQFPSLIETYQSLFCKIYVQRCLVGVALLVLGPKALSVKYLYYEESFSSTVYGALLMHGIKCGSERFETNDFYFADYIRTFGIYTKSLTHDYSFSAPESVISAGQDFCIQLGEGDVFV